jgi:hypothetical protein
MARHALEARRDDPDTMSEATYALLGVSGEAAMAAAVLDRAVMLNPNNAVAWVCKVHIHADRNQPEARGVYATKFA